MNNDATQFLAGFDLSGRRMDDGKLKSYHSNTVIDDCPKTLELLGHTYTLEEVVKGTNGYESAIYC